MNRKELKKFYNSAEHYYLKYALDSNIMIITVAFNYPKLIELQHALLKKNIIDKFSYFLIDNSDSSEASEAIRMLAYKNKFNYVKLLPNPHYEHPSKSHGLGLNWAVHNIIKRYKPAYFIFLDHDIFPIEKYNFILNLDSQPFYGLKQNRNENWYLWPGFSFYIRNRFILRNLDFFPADGLDTGGAMWKNIFSSHSCHEIKFASREKHDLGESGDAQKDSYEIIDDCWLHIINGSNWARIEDMSKKDALLSSLTSLI